MRIASAALAVVLLTGCSSAPVREPAWVGQVRRIETPPPGRLEVTAPGNVPVWVYNTPREAGIVHACGVSGPQLTLGEQRESAYKDAVAILGEFLSTRIELVDRTVAADGIHVRIAKSRRDQRGGVRSAPIVAEWLDVRGDAGFGKGVYFVLVSLEWEGAVPGDRPSVEDPRTLPGWVLTVPQSKDAVYQWGFFGGTLNPWRARRRAMQDAQDKLARVIAFRISDFMAQREKDTFKRYQEQRRIVSKAVLEHAEVVSVWPDVRGQAGLGSQTFVLMKMPLARVPGSGAVRVEPADIGECELGSEPDWLSELPAEPSEIYAFGSYPIDGSLNPKEAFENAFQDAVTRLARVVSVSISEEIKVWTSASTMLRDRYVEQASQLMMEGAQIVAYWPDLRGLRGRRYYVLVKAPLRSLAGG